MVKSNGAVLLATQVQIDILKLFLDQAYWVNLLLKLGGSEYVLGRVERNACDGWGAQGYLEDLFEIIQDIEA